MKIKTLDIYARVSNRPSEDSTSIEGQVFACRKRLEKAGAQVGRVFTDPGKSAWKKKAKRPGWDALMAWLESGESDGVVVFNLARFARRPVDGERLIDAAERGLTVLDSGTEYDLTSSSGKESFRHKLVGAAAYSDDVSEGSRRGKEYKATVQGQVDKRRSFGFEHDGVNVNEGEAAIIRDCARRLLAGEPQDSIIRELNNTGVPTVRGARWGYTTFRQIMLRPRNIGLIVHNGQVVEGKRLPGEPILDRDTHERIKSLYDRRKPGRQWSGRYVLTGIAECACGAPLGGRPVSGTSRKQYWCKACRHTFVDTNRLEDWAGDFVMRTLSDPEHADALAQADRELDAKRQALLTEQATHEADLIDVTARLGTPGWSRARVDAGCKGLEQRLGQISTELARLAEDERPPLPPNVRTISVRSQNRIHWLEQWTEGTPAEQRAMVLRALGGRCMIIGPGKDAIFDPNRVTIQ